MGVILRAVVLCGIALDKVTDAARMLPEGGEAHIQDDRLYWVVADLYSGQMLGAVEAQSMGLLTVTPQDENGAPVTDLESRIVKALTVRS